MTAARTIRVIFLLFQAASVRTTLPGQVHRGYSTSVDRHHSDVTPDANSPVIYIGRRESQIRKAKNSEQSPRSAFRRTPPERTQKPGKLRTNPDLSASANGEHAIGGEALSRFSCHLFASFLCGGTILYLSLQSACASFAGIMRMNFNGEKPSHQVSSSPFLRTYSPS